MDLIYNFQSLYNPHVIIKKIFGNFYWETTNNNILFTFDDGPCSETTLKILKILNAQNIKALFFCVGENVLRNPGLVKEILAEGHLIGNHTYNHQKITGVKKEKVINQIISFNRLLEDKFNYQTIFFRPPYGRFNFSTGSILREQRLVNVMWSLLTYDFKNDINLVKFAVNKYLKNNSIVVLHDNAACKDITDYSIQYIIDNIHNKGFQIGKPEECLKQSF